MIYLTKKTGKKKDAFRITDEKSIPVFLAQSVHISGGKVILDCAEGTEHCRLGEVIAYEKSETTKSGWNCWVVGNAAISLEEIDGAFYQKPTVIQAERITETIPEFLSGAEVVYDKESDTFNLKTAWGISSCKRGEGYWILYGISSDGRPDANILQVSEASFQDYYVCSEDGEIFGKLIDYHHQIY